MKDKLTSFQKLWVNVKPLYPLLAYKILENEIVKRFGEATVESDEHDYAPGPCRYWHTRYNCGLEIVLQYHISIDEILIFSSAFELDHITIHLNISNSPHWSVSELNEKEKMETLNVFEKAGGWCLKRLDDNANEIVMYSGLSERAARCMALIYENRGHKQTYTASIEV